MNSVTNYVTYLVIKDEENALSTDITWKMDVKVLVGINK